MPSSGLMPFDSRKVKVDETDVEFNVLVIDKPEKWLPATEFQFIGTIQLKGSSKKLKIPLRGISYGEWEVIETKYTIPEQPEGILSEAQRAEHQRKVQEISLKRRVEIFELSTGKKIDGATIEEKVEWILGFGSGDLEAFFERIINHFSGIDDGNLLYSYQEAAKKGVEEVDINSLDDLLKATQSGSSFLIQRPFEDFLVEFPLRSISEKQKREIEKQNPLPQAPGKPGRNPATGKPDPNIIERNFEDPRYKSQIKLHRRKELILSLEAALPFSIPGKDTDSKSKWIYDRLIGDVIKLRNYVQDHMLDYRGRLDFFSSDFAPPNLMDISSTKTPSTKSRH